MDTLLTPDGLRLHLRRWPATGPTHGTVQIVHGLGEHLGRYEALAQALNARGWHVAGHDQRGHGRSEGGRGAIAGIHALLVDLAAVIDHLRGPGRHVLLGHSLGGLVAARFVAESAGLEAARWSRDIDGLVLSSPALRIHLSPLQRLLVATLSRVAPGLRVGNGLRPAWICRDPAVVRAYVDDPLVHDRITPLLTRFMVEAAAVVHSRAAQWRTPTLLMWAGADRCVDASGSARFAASAPSSVVSAEPFAPLFHEIFNEPERDQVIAALTVWLARQGV